MRQQKHTEMQLSQNYRSRKQAASLLFLNKKVFFQICIYGMIRVERNGEFDGIKIS